MLNKRDVVFIVLCVILAGVVFVPAAKWVKEEAAGTLCISNLQEWGNFFQAYLADYDYYFPEGQMYKLDEDRGFWWVVLKPYYGDNNDLKFCPKATNPIYGGTGRWGDPGSAWGDFSHLRAGSAPTVKLMRRAGAGSCGINSWVYNQTPGIVSCDWKGYWHTADVNGVSNIPVFMDCSWPNASDVQHDNAPQGSPNGFRNVCLDRHNGEVGVLFMDFRARKVGLKELWTLKWSRIYDIEGPWTTAGGVKPEDWPKWMRKFKDY